MLQHDWLQPVTLRTNTLQQSHSAFSALSLTLASMVFRDGVMDAAGPKPCAAMRGTTILVEDLFYNSLTRKKVCPCQKPSILVFTGLRARCSTRPQLPADHGAEP